MENGASSREVSGLSPAEAFALVGNEHRVAIVEALLELHRDEIEYPASFSVLRKTAGMEVSSQFSYHLDQLNGHYLKQTEQGYTFRYAGWKVATAILAGTYNQRGEFESISIEGVCPLCQTALLTATYQNEWMQIDCRGCESTLTRYPFPPGGLVNRPSAEFLRVFDRQVRGDVRLARDDICPACTGPMRPSVETENGGRVETRDIGYSCERCGNRLHPTLGLLLLETPSVRDFYQNEGIAIDSKPFWEFPACVDAESIEVSDSGSWQFRVRFSVDDDLYVDLDEELNIVSTTIKRE